VRRTINKRPPKRHTGSIEALPLGPAAPSVPDHWPPPKEEQGSGTHRIPATGFGWGWKDVRERQLMMLWTAPPPAHECH